MSDRIHDGEMNADKRELAAARQCIADMKATLLKHAAAGARLDKIMLAICLTIAAVAIAGFAVVTFYPPAPNVTFYQPTADLAACQAAFSDAVDYCVKISDELLTCRAAHVRIDMPRARDRDALGAWQISRIMDWSVQP